jgi:AcrR family transcriptional regulator
MADTPPVGRRERLRADTYAEIKKAALAQVAAEGASALSVRGIARAIGMSPAGLYRYYDSLAALLTDLIADAYNELADAVSAASSEPGSLAERLRLAMHAYRDWALAERQRFLLIFGTPLPGYEAPANGPTEVANRRLGAVFFQLAAHAHAQGSLNVPPVSRPPTSRELAAAASLGVELPPVAVAALLSAYAHLHGLVILEVLGQFDWVYPGTDANAFFSDETHRIAERLFS